MIKLRNSLLVALAIFLFFPSLQAQFQNVYTITKDSIGFGEFRQIAPLNLNGGTDMEYAAIGTNRNSTPWNGTLAWLDQDGNPLLFRRIWSKPEFDRNIEGRDVCEAAWDNELMATTFYEERLSPTPVVQRSVIIYVNKITKLRIPRRTREIKDFEVRSMISVISQNDDAVLYLTGNDLTTGDMAVHAVDQNGFTVWSTVVQVLDPTTGGVAPAQAFDIEYLPARDEFVVVGTADIGGPVSQEVVMFTLNSNGGLTQGNYYALFGGNLTGKTIIPSGPLASTHKVLIGGEYNLPGLPLRPAFIEIDLNNINSISRDFLWAPDSPPYAGTFTVEDLASDGNDKFIATGTLNEDQDQGYSLRLNVPSSGAISDGTVMVHDVGGLANTGNQLHGAAYNGLRNVFPLVGKYDPTAGVPGPEAYWALGTDDMGQSSCFGSILAIDTPLFPSIDIFVPGAITVGEIVRQASVGYQSVPNTFAAQCGSSKSQPVADEEIGSSELFVAQTAEMLSLRFEGLHNETAKVVLADLQGRKLWTGMVGNANQEIPTKQLGAGVYFLTWETGSGVAGTRKIAVLK